jgi:hypothetical protein
MCGIRGGNWESAAFLLIAYNLAWVSPFADRSAARVHACVRGEEAESSGRRQEEEEEELDKDWRARWKASAEDQSNVISKGRESYDAQ